MQQLLVELAYRQSGLIGDLWVSHFPLPVDAQTCEEPTTGNQRPPVAYTRGKCGRISTQASKSTIGAPQLWSATSQISNKTGRTLGWDNAPEDVVNGDDATLPHQAQQQLKVARIAALVRICAPRAAPQELLRAARVSAATYPARLSPVTQS